MIGEEESAGRHRQTQTERQWQRQRKKKNAAKVERGGTTVAAAVERMSDEGAAVVQSHSS